MKRRTVLTIALVLAQGACSAPPGADQRRAAANDLNPSGRPYVGPPGVLSSAPPADTSFNRLYCRQEYQGAVCSRDRTGSPPAPEGP